ncbi:hypothetical protein MMC11_003882 [Xylographa trunciseda]|nr:hypothetical protein [Xylographa trunciseda]
MSDFSSMDRAFEASLETTSSFADGQLRTGDADTEHFTLKTRTSTWRTFGSKSSKFQRTESQMTPKGCLQADIKNGLSPPQTYTNPDTGISQPLPPDEDEDDEDEPEALLNPPDIKVGDENREFSFDKLREIHKLAEKANEATMSLKQNIVVLSQLKQYYRSILMRQNFPKELANTCKDAVDGFELCIEGLEHDIQMQVLRLETLLYLMEERKTLVRQIIPTLDPNDRAKSKLAP